MPLSKRIMHLIDRLAAWLTPAPMPEARPIPVRINQPSAYRRGGRRV